MGTPAVLESELRSAVASRVGEARFGVWFGDGVRLGVDGDNLVVDVPNRFFREWIEGHYAGSLIEAATAVAGRPLRLDVRIDAEAEPPPSNVVPGTSPDERRRPATTVPAPAPARPRPTTGRLTASSQRAVELEPSGEREREREREQGRQQSRLATGSTVSNRPVRRLEDFVTGAGNRLAHAAAVEMARSRGSSFNPLVIAGGVGLGKTHLLEGIAASLRAGHARLNVVATTAEAFTNGFLDAMRTGSLGRFRDKYRQAEALILDDVHFLATTRATQNEFLHTFNALVSAGAPIVLTSDLHPRLIAKLTEELVTRFLGGMVVKLEPPDPATRRAILKAKAAARGVDVPEAVLTYIAEHLRASVRELEGAINSVLAHAVLTGKRIDMNLARSALRDTIRHTAQAVALKDIERAICAMFSLDVDHLHSASRARGVAHPRMLAMYLARKHTGASYSEIGRYFGGRNHSTVISAEKKVASWLRDEQRVGLLAGFESMADILASLERALGT